MTDRPFDPLPPDERDLLVTAYIDGEATPAERARVDADPELRAYAEQLRAMKDRVAGVAPLRPERRQELLAAALAEHDSSRSATTATTPSEEPVRSIAPTSPRRSPTSRWLAVAAAVVVAFAGGAVVANQFGDGGDDDDTTAAVEDAAADTTGGGDTPTGGATRSAADASATTTTEVSKDEGAHVASPQTPAISSPGEQESGGTIPVPTAMSSDLSEAAALDRPPDDGGSLLVLSGDADLADWYGAVTDGSLAPRGAGDERCEQRVIGWAELRRSAGEDDHFASSYVVVVERPAGRLVALDASTCEPELVARVP